MHNHYAMYSLPAFSLEQLHTLRAIAEEGSFSRAAGRRNLSQPAVSHQMRLLEDRLGTRLLSRVGRRVTLTEEGALLLSHAARAIQELETATTRLLNRRGVVAGDVRLGCGATAATYLLPPYIGLFCQRYPEASFRLVTGDTPQLAEAVLRNDLDAALVTLPVPGQMLVVSPLLSDPLVGIVGRGQSKGARSLTPTQLSRFQLVLYESGGTIRRVIDRWLKRSSRPVKVALELGNIEAIKHVVATGFGAAIVPQMALRGDGTNGDLDVFDLKPAVSRTLALITRRDNASSPPLVAYASLLKSISASPT